MTRLAINGSNVDKQSCLTIKDGHVTDIDWEGFIKAITRMKPTPAFDDLGLNSPECEEFGDESVYARHFTETAQRYSDVPAELADDSVIKLMNPTRYIDSETVAEHWRIRHGTHDRDTSLAVPAILALLPAVGTPSQWGLRSGKSVCLDRQNRQRSSGRSLIPVFDQPKSLYQFIGILEYIWTVNKYSENSEGWSKKDTPSLFSY